MEYFKDIQDSLFFICEKYELIILKKYNKIVKNETEDWKVKVFLIY